MAGSFSVMRPGIPGSDRSEMLQQWPESEARRLFAAKAEGFVKAGADLIAMEMMRDGDYSVWATEAAAATGLPVWVGIAVEEDDDGRLIGFGRPNWLLEDFVEPLLRSAPAMVSVMHTRTARDRAGVGDRAPSLARSLGAYAESGYFAMPDWQFVDIIPEAEYVELAKQWAEQFDLAMIGGCCGIGPSHIAALRAAFKPDVGPGDASGLGGAGEDDVAGGDVDACLRLDRDRPLGREPLTSTTLRTCWSSALSSSRTACAPGIVDQPQLVRLARPRIGQPVAHHHRLAVTRRPRDLERSGARPVNVVDRGVGLVEDRFGGLVA